MFFLQYHAPRVLNTFNGFFTNSSFECNFTVTFLMLKSDKKRTDTQRIAEASQAMAFTRKMFFSRRGEGGSFRVGRYGNRILLRHLMKLILSSFVCRERERDKERTYSNTNYFGPGTGGRSSFDRLDHLVSLVSFRLFETRQDLFNFARFDGYVRLTGNFRTSHFKRPGHVAL